PMPSSLWKPVCVIAPRHDVLPCSAVSGASKASVRRSTSMSCAADAWTSSQCGGPSSSRVSLAYAWRAATAVDGSSLKAVAARVRVLAREYQVGPRRGSAQTIQRRGATFRCRALSAVFLPARLAPQRFELGVHVVLVARGLRHTLRRRCDPLARGRD